MVDAAMQQCWQAGGKPTLAVMSGNIKAYFATLSQGGTGNAVVAQNIQNVTGREEVTIQGAVDVYAPTSARSNWPQIVSCPYTRSFSYRPTTPKWHRCLSVT